MMLKKIKKMTTLIHTNGEMGEYWKLSENLRRSKANIFAYVHDKMHTY